MATSTTSTVYINVIEDVINKVRDEFVNNRGPGESVLNELQGLWEMKMIQTGAVLGPIERSSAPRTVPGPAITPVHDLNMPYEGTEEYETPTAEMLFPPTPLQTPIQTPLPGTVDSSMYNIPTGSTDYPTPTSNEVASGAPDIKPGAGRPSPYMQPPSPWMNQRPSLGVDVNVAYVDGREDPDRGASRSSNQEFLTGPPGKRKRDDLIPQYQAGKFIPQQDGAGDAAPDIFELEIIQSKSLGKSDTLKITNGKAASVSQKVSPRIPQLDGPIPDPFDDMLSTPNIYNYQGVTSEDYNLVNTPAPDLLASTPFGPPPNDVPEDDDDDEPPLNENDDDELDDLDEGEELNTHHLVLAQFDKVTRTKSRWKCTLKDGIMHINNKDILFNKATGEFDF